MGFVRYIKNQFRHDRNIKKSLFENQKEIEKLKKKIDDLSLGLCVNSLHEKTLYSNEKGVSSERFCETDVIVSLTTFGKRIYDVYLAIESIMQGTMKPNRIVLWLSEDEFNGKVLPITLRKQQERGLEIQFCKDIRSYTKLIPALRQYPDACIITIDDDVMYEFDIIERLVNSHIEYPKAVCACRVHRIRLSDNKPKSYINWEWGVSDSAEQTPLLFPTGVGGVLYPSNCFPQEVFNEDVFMDICPYADDVWFYAMELLNDTPIVHTYTGKHGGYFVNLPTGRINALSKENTNELCCRNDSQIKAVFEKYNLYEKLL